MLTSLPHIEMLVFDFGVFGLVKKILMWPTHFFQPILDHIKYQQYCFSVLEVSTFFTKTTSYLNGTP